MSEKLSTDPYKGVRDFYPEDMAIQRYIFDVWAQVAESYGFERYDASILEPAELYRAKTGEEIVNEQTYTFKDRGGREVTLRPEMTPTVARMVAGRMRDLSFPLRWYSIPNLFRYERTQRGRLREHWQLNCDIFGVDNGYADAEIIALAYNILKKFGAKDNDFVIYVNDRQLLNDYFVSLNLSEDKIHQMYKLLDRKDKIDTFEQNASAIIGRAFNEDELDLTSQRLTSCLDTLKTLGITNVQFKPSVVRGFDYYDGIVFEIFDKAPENNRSLFGGGRYNQLVRLFDEESISAVGFGMGDVTMRDFLETHKLLPHPSIGPRIMILVASPTVLIDALKVREEIRKQNIPVAIDLRMTRKLTDQLSRAAKRGVPYIIVVGEDELASGTYTLRDMTSGKEVRGTIAELVAHIA